MSFFADFPKKKRLLSSEDFHSLRKESRTISGDGFKMLLKPASNRKGTSRLGMVVSSKVGKAVKRNRIKRLVREVFRKTYISSATDIIFICYPSVSVNRLTINLKEVFTKV